ncbi:MAG: hypothetical protein ABW189_01380 [Rickettsiales bacterium]
MAKTVLRNQKIFVGGIALSDRANAIALDYRCEPKDSTSFDDAEGGFRARLPGVRDATVGADGFVEIDAKDAALFAGVGGSAVPFSFPLNGETVGAAAYFFDAIHTELNLELQHGELFRFKLSGEGAGDLVRGKILKTSSAAVSAGGNGAAVHVAPTDNGERLFAALHVVSASGTLPTLDVNIQSDGASDMASPTDRLTFSQKTGAGSQLLAASPNSADEYYRVSYTVGGTGASFAFFVAVGVLPSI